MTTGVRTVKSFSDSDRAKAQETLKARQQAGKAKYPARLGDVLADSEAQKRGIRLPATWKAPTAHALSGWAKRLGIADAPECYGFNTWAEYIGKNPSWSLRQLVGIMLEDSPSA